MSHQIIRYKSPLGLPFSRALRAGEDLYLAGQVPLDEDGNVVRGDIQTQTRAAMDRIIETLTECGASLADVVKVQVWLSDIDLFDGFNAAYAGYFSGDFPPRATVEARLSLGVDVEIQMQAWLPGNKS